MKKIYILYVFLLSSVAALAQTTVPVKHADDGRRIVVPTMTNPNLLPSGTSGQTLLHNGSAFQSVNADGSSFQGLVNYWVKTVNDLSYAAGDVTVGSAANARRFITYGEIGVEFQNNAPPVSPKFLSMGTYNALPAAGAYNAIFASSGGIGADPLGGLYLMARSDSDVPSNIFFKTGTARSTKLTIAADGIYHNQLTGAAVGFGVYGTDGKEGRRELANGFTISPTTIAPDLSFINYWTKTGNNLSYTAGQVHIGTLGGALDMPLKVGGGIGVDYSTAPMTVGANCSIIMGRLDALPTNVFTSYIASVGNSFDGNLIGETVYGTRSNGSGAEAHHFYSGTGTPVKRLSVGSDVKFHTIGIDNAAATIYAKNTSGNLVERSVASLPTGVTSVGSTVAPTANAASISGSTLNIGQADGSNPGVIQLAGDLAGGYASPQIAGNAVGTPELANDAVTMAKIADSGATSGQVIGYNGTDWVPTTVSSGVTTIGTYQTTNNPNGASILGSDLRLHRVNGLAPGIVDTFDQQFGRGTKTFTKAGNSITTPLIARNTSADVANEGAGILIVGAAETNLAQFDGQSTSGGGISVLKSSNGTSLVQMIAANGATNTVSITGFSQRDVQHIAQGISYDVTASLANRKGTYIFDGTGNSTLLLPDPALLPEGTTIQWVNGAITNNCTINSTSVATNDFISTGGASSSLTITPGYKAGILEVNVVGGVTYWANRIYN
jgi:hypothetical protein